MKQQLTGAKAGDCAGFTRDILEWDIPEEVLAVLLKDRTTGKNLIWATEDYTTRGVGFGVYDEIRIEQVTDKNNPVIRPRVDKAAEEQRKRIEKRAEVFTPSWICNKQNNLVDAAWFNWNKQNSSPFNTEVDKFDPEKEFGWKSTCGKHIKFPKGKAWQEYVKAPRLEVSCGEAPYLTSRYDTVSGRVIPVDDRIGLLDRKLRVITENIGTCDPQDWLYYAKRAVQSVYGFDWQGDNVLLARENVLFTVVETYNSDFLEESSSHSKWTKKSLLEFAEIISWNIWQMDGIKYVVPMSCHATEETDLLGTVTRRECPGCKRKDNSRHTGNYCMVMDWQSTPIPTPVRFIDLMGGK